MSRQEEENEKQGGLKVVDKRRFESDGTTRGDSPSEAKSAVSSAAPEKSASREEASAKNAQQEQTKTSRADSGSARYQQADFSSFIVGLATQALMMLGEMPNPETNRPMVNIEGARQTIDLLAVLEEKTRGNLTPEENALLGEILASLRMAFVGRLKG